MLKLFLKIKKKYKGELIADIVVKSKDNLKGVNCPRSLNSSAIDEFLVIFLVAAKLKVFHILVIWENWIKKRAPD